MKTNIINTLNNIEILIGQYKNEISKLSNERKLVEKRFKHCSEKCNNLN